MWINFPQTSAKEVFLNKFKRAILFVNGDSTPGYSLKILPSDWLVAVDGGLRHILVSKRLPNLLIGDLDSVSPSDLSSCEVAKVEIIRFPPVKDQTDLELALNLSLERGFKQVVIAYAQGSRVDHSLANLSLLARPDLHSIDVKLDDGKTEIALLKGPGKLALTTKVGNLVSLIPWGQPAKGITTNNLQYALTDETLLPWQTRGVSNIATAKNVTICLREGDLFVLHARPEIGPKGKS